MLYSGASKVAFCLSLGDDWRHLADYLEIPPHEQARFDNGYESRGIWAWLENRGELPRLTEALSHIRRQDLLAVLVERQHTATRNQAWFKWTPAQGNTFLWNTSSFHLLRPSECYLDLNHARNHYQSRIAQWSDPRYALDKRFVQLTLLLDQGEEAQRPRWAAQTRQFQELREVLAAVPDPALVLLGPSGSGKSTLLRHFELDNAAAVLANGADNDFSAAPVTFFLPLNAYRARQDGTLPLPWDWLTERWAAAYPDLPPLDTLLRSRQLILLLDALNEIPYAGTEPIRLWKDFLRDLDRERPGNRVIFSCRSLDYSAPLSSRDLRVPQVRIEPLADAQVQHFVELYCPQYAAVLWDNLAGLPQLELLRFPYYLKLLVEQTEAGEIPAGRAALFTGFVRQALKREVEADNPLFQPAALLHPRDHRRLVQARHWETPYELPSRGILFAKLSTLAYAMQAQHTERTAAQVRIGYDAALDILDSEQDEAILKAGEALGVLEEDLGRDEVLYVHQLLQEYFAARQLAATPEPERVQTEWHSDKVFPSLEDTLASLADSDPLPMLSTTWAGRRPRCWPPP